MRTSKTHTQSKDEGGVCERRPWFGGSAGIAHRFPPAWGGCIGTIAVDEGHGRALRHGIVRRRGCPFLPKKCAGNWRKCYDRNQTTIGNQSRGRGARGKAAQWLARQGNQDGQGRPQASCEDPRNARRGAGGSGEEKAAQEV